MDVLRGRAGAHVKGSCRYGTLGIEEKKEDHVELVGCGIREARALGVRWRMKYPVGHGENEIATHHF